MLQIILVQPGSTDFDEQGRIKGTLDIPLNENGEAQVQRVCDELSKMQISTIYTSPCQSSLQTAEELARGREMKVKKIENLKNLDHGLWHGKLIQEVKQQQPKVYRQWQERPETVCPPGGESLAEAQKRVKSVLKKLLKKHQGGMIAIVLPEPLARMMRCLLNASQLGDLWKAECDCGGWEVIEVGSKQASC